MQQTPLTAAFYYFSTHSYFCKQEIAYRPKPISKAVFSVSKGDNGKTFSNIHPSQYSQLSSSPDFSISSWERRASSLAQISEASDGS